MRQVTVNFKMNEDIKTRFDAVSNQLGISASTLYNLFAKNVITYRKLPFSICVEDEQKKEEMFQKLINLWKMSVQVPQEIKDKLNLTQKDINDIVYKFRKGKSK